MAKGIILILYLSAGVMLGIALLTSLNCASTPDEYGLSPRERHELENENPSALQPALPELEEEPPAEPSWEELIPNQVLAPFCYEDEDRLRPYRLANRY